MKARFIVESPLQLLMAIEAREQFELGDDCELVVLWTSAEASIQSIQDVLDASPWENVIDGGPRSLRNMPSRAKLIRDLGDNPCELLFVGDYFSPFMRHSLNLQPDGSGWLLDDGRGTFQAWELRSCPTAIDRRPDTTSWSRQLALRALRLKFQEPASLNYFTFFDLVPKPTDQTKRNELGWLRSRLPTSTTDGSVLLLGAPFVERSHATSEQYSLLLESIAASSTSVKYRPHRDEDPEKLRVLAERFGIEVVSGSGTIELALTQSDTLPSKIMSFFSSATLTLQLLVGDIVQVGSYALEDSDFVPGWFAIGDGLPVLLEQTDHKIVVEPIPGRSQESISRYLNQTGGS